MTSGLQRHKTYGAPTHVQDDGAFECLRGLVLMSNAGMIRSSRLGSIAHYVGKEQKSLGPASLTICGNRSGTSRNQLRELRNKRRSLGGERSVQNAVLQTSIFPSFTVLQFGNV